MVLSNQLEKVRLDDFALGLGYIIDPASVDLMPRAEKTLPSGYRVGSDNRAEISWLVSMRS